MKNTYNNNELISSIVQFNQEVDIELIKQLTNVEYTHNTQLALMSDWNRFINFCQLKHFQALPASTSTLRQFIQHEAIHRKISTLKRYVISIGIIHKYHKVPDPTQHRQIKMLQGMLRMEKKGDAKQANKFTEQHLAALEKKLSTSPLLKDIRDLSIYFIMFECALKRSELKNLIASDIISSLNTQTTVYFQSQAYRLSTQASYYLNKWLSCSKPAKDDFVFKAIDRHGNLSISSLNDSSIYRVMRRASELLSLPTTLHFSGQSGRIGAVKALAKKGLNIKEIQAFGRWNSPVMPSQYLGQTEQSEREQLQFVRIRPWE